MRRVAALLMASLMSISMVFTAPVTTEAAAESKAETTVEVVEEMTSAADISMRETSASKFTWEGDQIKKYIGTDKQVVIPSRCVAIMSSAFYNTGVTSVDLSQSKVSFIGNYAFQNCRSLKKVVLNTRLNEIGYSAFSGCAALTSCNFKGADSLATIGDYAFNNTGLSTVTLPSKVNYIGSRAFANCARLKTFKFNKLFMNNPASRGTYIFNNDPLMLNAGTASTDNFIFPSGTISIPENLFSYCNFLKNVTVPSGVIEIKKSAFDRAENLKKVVFNSKLAKIYDYAFYKCTALSAANFKEAISLTTIGQYAFSETALKTVRFPSSMQYLATGAFSNCFSLTKLEINKRLLNSGTVDVASYYTAPFNNCTGLRTLGTASTCNIVIPSGTTSIPNSLFRSMTSLSKVTLPSSVLTIGEYAFASCNSLSKVVLNAKLTTIGYSAFKNSSVLSAVNFKEATSLSTIEEYAFSGTNLQTVRLPKRVAAIGRYAFSNNNYLQHVYFYCENVSMSSYDWTTVFNNAYTTFHVYKNTTTANSLRAVDNFAGRVKNMSR